MSSPSEPGHTDEDPGGRPAGIGREVFESRADQASYVRRFVPTLVLMVALGWLIVTLVLNAIGLPLPGLIALVPAGALGVYGYQFQVKRFREVHAAATLTLSEQGAELVDVNTRVVIAWPDATRIGAGDMMGPLKVTLTDNEAVRAVSAGARASTQRTLDVLYGTGSMEVSPDASALVRATIEQNAGGRDLGRTEVGIPLSTYDPEWRTGRIGEWIAVRRPDLLG